MRNKATYKQLLQSYYGQFKLNLKFILFLLILLTFSLLYADYFFEQSTNYLLYKEHDESNPILKEALQRFGRDIAERNDAIFDTGGAWKGCYQYSCSNEVCSQALRNILFFIKDLFEKHNLLYFVEGGALLGGVRNNDLILWDKDIDLAMAANDLIKMQKTKEITDALEDAGIHFFIDEKWKDGRLCLKKGSRLLPKSIEDADIYSLANNFYKPSYWWHKNFSKKPPYVDLAPLGIVEERSYNSNKILIHWEGFPCKILYNDTDVFPLTTITIQDREIPAPKEYKKYLVYLYGPEWNAPHESYYISYYCPHYITGFPKAESAWSTLTEWGFGVM